MSFNPVDVSFQTTSTDKDEEITEPCDLETKRLCADGSCIFKNALCEEEEVMNQNTILIMIVVGMAVVIFLIILYCFQQKTQTRTNTTNRESMFEAGLGEGDNASLYNPPPPYDEVITSGLYPPTPQSQRQTRISSSDEPMTPPPNYEAALNILAQSHESVLVKGAKSSVFRRSVSVDSVSRPNRSSPSRTSRQFSFFQSIGT
ncbi:hypothetical protein SNE40_007451 [Patella caerulea]